MSIGTDNIEKVLAEATAEDWSYGLHWYEAAHLWCEGVARSFDVTVEVAAALTAILSPRVNWGVCMALVVDFLTDNDAPTFDRSLAKCREIVEAGSPDVGYSFGDKSYSTCVNGPKVSRFYECILDPNSTRAVVVDRHAYDIWMGKVGTDRSRKQLERKGTPERIERDYQAVADSRGLPPHVVQAVTWCTWRRIKGVVDAYTEMEDF